MKITESAYLKNIKKRGLDPYFTTKDIGNSGLGLSVSFGLIVQAKNTISVDSKEGEGTTFRIALHISGTQEVSKASTAKSHETKPLKILVVDDEKQIVDLLTIMLDVGHKIVGVSGRKAGLPVVLVTGWGAEY